MMRILISKEILEHLLRERFLIVTILCVALVGVSAWVMMADYSKRLANHEASLSRNRELFNDYVYRYPSGAWYSDFAGEQRIVRRPTSLSIFVKGLDERMGRPARFDYTAQIDYDEVQERNLLFFLFQTPDLGFIVRVVMSLAALLFIFDMTS